MIKNTSKEWNRRYRFAATAVIFEISVFECAQAFFIALAGLDFYFNIHVFFISITFISILRLRFAKN